jgi:hypothetical protein
LLNRYGIAIALGAVLCSGCKLNIVAKRSNDSIKRPSDSGHAVVAGSVGSAQLPDPTRHRATVATPAASKIRLAAAGDDDVTAGELLPAPDPSALSLDDAIETGLAQNPDLVAMRQAEGVSVAALGVAQT